MTHELLSGRKWHSYIKEAVAAFEKNNEDELFLSRIKKGIKARRAALKNLLKDHKNGKPVIALQNKYGIATATMAKILEENNVASRRQAARQRKASKIIEHGKI